MTRKPLTLASLARPQLNCDAGRRRGVEVYLNPGRIIALPARLARSGKISVDRRASLLGWALRLRSNDRRLLLQADNDLRRNVFRPLQRCSPQMASTRPGLTAIWKALGISTMHEKIASTTLFAEPTLLHFAGFDRYRRPLWLAQPAARAWKAMVRSALSEGIVLQAISGFRSIDYQASIIRNKLARGQSLEQILRVNAAPGCSEHHSGRAIDIGTPGEPAAEVSFEDTRAFRWLQAKAQRFGFVMSYPRDNLSGIQYEPWHWCWHPRLHGQHARG